MSEPNTMSIHSIFFTKSQKCKLSCGSREKVRDHQISRNHHLHTMNHHLVILEVFQSRQSRGPTNNRAQVIHWWYFYGKNTLWFTKGNIGESRNSVQVHFGFISIWAKIQFRSDPPWPHTLADSPFTGATLLKDSESASQYEPNLIHGAETWAAMRQAESCDVTGWETSTPSTCWEKRWGREQAM